MVFRHPWRDVNINHALNGLSLAMENDPELPSNVLRTAFPAYMDPYGIAPADDEEELFGIPGLNYGF